ncbi:cytochrome c oxidase subunit 1 [Physocladia obscura]|uniref:Cytochrome c oxidase subunit 1 n=1 Tax=Physocladia obscura TaxID=109957 RepID=A0AAD5T8M3_9FUNG|nr:cytochrome c oxidase subunit 1 [Physocladia obscura]
MDQKRALINNLEAIEAIEKNLEGTDDWHVPAQLKENPYFVEVTTSLPAALRELDTRMRGSKDYHLISKKGKRPFGGRVIQTGDVGIWNRNGRPVINLEAGNYWNFSIRHTFEGKYSITSPIDTLGLTTVLVGQSEAAVVMDPANRIFVIRNSGFAAYGSQGRFKVIDIVDTLNLGDGHAHYEKLANGSNGPVLGWKRDVSISVGASKITVATFFLVPANNVLILQRSNNLLLLKAGQHVITNPNTSFRGFYSLGERQVTFKTQPAYTIEGVPVILNVNLRYRVTDPILLTANYNDAFTALANPAQTAVNSVVSRLSYQQFMRAQKIGGDVPDIHVQPWLDSFKANCLADLSHQAVSYGITVESFDVLDRELEGNLGKDLEKQSEQVLRNQIQATQIALTNQIATETQRGKLEIAKVEAEQKKTIADADYYTAAKLSDAKAYQVVKNAQAAAEASQLETDQSVKNIIALADAKRREIEVIGSAYGKVPDGHAQRMQLSSFEVEKRKALPENTVYFAGDRSETNQTLVTSGFEQATGWALANKNLKQNGVNGSITKNSKEWVEDMITLADLSEITIRENLKSRFQAEHIYTYTGSILVALNPYKPLDIFGNATIAKYDNADRKTNPPHIFALSDATIKNIRIENKNQSVIISGESGSGKSESTKYILSYLTTVTSKSSNISWIHQQILEANIVLESFGNAKTSRNNNSSRFGKFIQVQLDKKMQIVGANITSYLLEKSRVARQAKTERNYHAFYELVQGANEEEKKEFLLQPSESYYYLNQSGCTDISGIDSRAKFEGLKFSLTVLNISAEDTDGIFRALSAILWLGNIQFKAQSGNESVRIQEGEALKNSATLLGVNENNLAKVLCFKKLVVRTETTMVPLKLSQNKKSMKKKKYSGKKFLMKIINRIKPQGILAQLDEEVKLPRGSEESWLLKLEQLHSKHKHFFKPKTKNNVFGVKHYAGDVLYTVDGFLEKNKDALQDELFDLVNSSTIPFISSLISPKELQDLPSCPGTPKLGLNRGSPANSSLSLASTNNTPHFIPKSSGKPAKITAGGNFKNQLNSLVSTLGMTTTHYVRCIKPNSMMEAFTFDDSKVVAQLRYSGMLETIKIRKAGFPTRVTFEIFNVDNRFLLPTQSQSMNSKEKTKFIIQSAYTRRFLFIVRYKRKRAAVLKIQSVTRGWLARKLLTNLKAVKFKKLKDEAEKREEELRELRALEAAAIERIAAERMVSEIKAAQLKLQGQQFEIANTTKAATALTDLLEKVNDIDGPKIVESDSVLPPEPTPLSRRTTEKLDEIFSFIKEFNSHEELTVLAQNLTTEINNLHEAKKVLLSTEKLEEQVNQISELQPNALSLQSYGELNFGMAQPYVDEKKQITKKKSLIDAFQGKKAVLGFHDVNTILRYNKNPLSSPITKIAEEDPCYFFATDISKQLLKALDTSTNKQDEISAAMQCIISQGLANETLRDEIFIQIIKQITPPADGEPKGWEEIVLHGWQLLALSIGTFPPSKSFSKFLLAFIMRANKTSKNTKKMLSLAAEQFAKSILIHGAHKLAPNISDIAAFRNGVVNKICKIYVMDGHAFDILISLVTTASEVVKEVGKKFNLKDTSCWALYITGGQIDKAVRSVEYLTDCMTLPKAAKKTGGLLSVFKIKPKDGIAYVDEPDEGFKFTLKKRIFKNLEEDMYAKDPREVHLLCCQVDHEVNNDVYPVGLREGVKLAALKAQIVLGDYNGSSAQLPEPSNIFQWITPRVMAKASKENTVKLIIEQYKLLMGQSQLSAKLEYLNLVKTFKFYGSTAFNVDNTGELVFNEPIQLLVSISGIKIVQVISREVAMIFLKDEIKDVTSGDGIVSIGVSSNLESVLEIYQFNCNQADELTSLAREYYGIKSSPKKVRIYTEAEIGSLSKDVATYRVNLIGADILRIPGPDSFAAEMLNNSSNSNKQYRGTLILPKSTNNRSPTPSSSKKSSSFALFSVKLDGDDSVMKTYSEMDWSFSRSKMVTSILAGHYDTADFSIGLNSFLSDFISLPSKPNDNDKSALNSLSCEAIDPKEKSGILLEQSKYAKYALKTLYQSIKSVARIYPPSADEINCAAKCNPLTVRFYALNRQFRALPINPSDSIETIYMSLMKKFGLSEASGFAIYQYYAKSELALFAEDKITDIIYKCERASSISRTTDKVHFIIKKRLFDNPQKIDVLLCEEEFVRWQIVEDIKNDRYPLKSDDLITCAALTAQIMFGDAVLEAIERLLSSEMIEKIKEKHVEFEGKESKFCHEQFMALLTRECWLAVGFDGIKILARRSLIILEEVGSKYVFSTENSRAIASLIKDYIDFHLDV